MLLYVSYEDALWLRGCLMQYAVVKICTIIWTTIVLKIKQ